MKEKLLDLLICPACLPAENRLTARIDEERRNDILTGRLACPACGRQYPIEDGIAALSVAPSDAAGNKYETPPVVSSYLWSHYGDCMADEKASDAYARWAKLMPPHAGLALDAGCAVGRFAFEMTAKCDFAVGLDTSRAFIREARHLMQQRRATIALKEEGYLTRRAQLALPGAWDSARVEFLVADALHLPFAADTIASFASLNLLDKVPLPLKHLREMNRVTRRQGAAFLLSDPYSWSEDAAREEDWLGGQRSGPYTQKGRDHIRRLLEGEGRILQPAWACEEEGHVWWTLRTHANHYESIRSCYIRARR